MKSNLFKKFEKSKLSKIAQVYGGIETSNGGTPGYGTDYDRKSTGIDNTDWRDSSKSRDDR